MKPKLIMMSHGHMAEETFRSAQMIAGAIEHTIIISMEAEDGLEGTQKKFQEALEQVGDHPTLILADLYGGTPFNVANMMSSKEPKKQIITGLNLAMVIEYALSQEEDLDALVNQLVMTGKDAVHSIIEEDDDVDIEE